MRNEKVDEKVKLKQIYLNKQPSLRFEDDVNSVMSNSLAVNDDTAPVASAAGNDKAVENAILTW